MGRNILESLAWVKQTIYGSAVKTALATVKASYHCILARNITIKLNSKCDVIFTKDPNMP